MFGQFLGKFLFCDVSLFHRNSKNCGEAKGHAYKTWQDLVSALKLIATSAYRGKLAVQNKENIL